MSAVGTSSTLAATSSSGLRVSYTATGACTVSGNRVTFTRADETCTVRAAQSGSSAVLPAPPIERTTVPVP